MRSFWTEIAWLGHRPSYGVPIPLAGLAQICETPSPKFGVEFQLFPYIRYFSRPRLLLAAILLPLACGTGCRMFNREIWDLNRYRDDRAVDIDQRLESGKPIVENPF